MIALRGLALKVNFHHLVLVDMVPQKDNELLEILLSVILRRFFGVEHGYLVLLICRYPVDEIK